MSHLTGPTAATAADTEYAEADDSDDSAIFRPRASLVAAILANELDGLEIHNPVFSMGIPGSNPAEDANYPESVPGTLLDADKAGLGKSVLAAHPGGAINTGTSAVLLPHDKASIDATAEGSELLTLPLPGLRTPELTPRRSSIGILHQLPASLAPARKE